MEKSFSIQTKEGLPQLKYWSKSEQRIMGNITGNSFPKDPESKGLPFLGQTEEQVRTTKRNAEIILNNEAMLDEFCRRTQRNKQEVIEYFKKLISE